MILGVIVANVAISLLVLWTEAGDDLLTESGSTIDMES